MKFGVREICDVVLKAKTTQKIGNKVFYKNEPVLYFDSLKTSNLEGSATTVYAQGGRGNSRLIAWEGERTVTFTMEDALLSPESFSILSGANLLTYDENSTETIKEHVIEETDLIEFFPGYQKSTAWVNGREYYIWDSTTHQFQSVGKLTRQQFDAGTYYDTQGSQTVFYSTIRFGNHYSGLSGDSINSDLSKWTQATAGWRWNVADINKSGTESFKGEDTEENPEDYFTVSHYFRTNTSSTIIKDAIYILDSTTGTYIPVNVVRYRRPNTYHLTYDTTINNSKTYYIYNSSNKQFEEVQEKRAEDINKYYEIGTSYYWKLVNDTVEDPYNRVYYRREYDGQRNTYGGNRVAIYVDQKPYFPVTKKADMYLTNYIYITRYKDGDCMTEPYLPWHIDYAEYMDFQALIENKPGNTIYNPDIYHKYRLHLRNPSPPESDHVTHEYSVGFLEGFYKNIETNPQNPPNYVLDDDCRVLVDYYTERPAGKKINITLDDFAGTYYLEGSTLFRSTNGEDLPAKFIIPNCKIQSNFTFTMAPSGDPSTFTFTIDALPDYTRFNRKQKVLAAIQILDSDNSEELLKRTDTPINNDFMNIAAQALREKTWTDFEPRET